MRPGGVIGTMALAGAVVAAAGCGDPAGWKRVEALDGAGSVAVPDTFTEETERGVRVLRGEGLTVTVHGASPRAREEVARGLRVQLDAFPGAHVEELAAGAEALRFHVRAPGEERLQVALLGEAAVLHVAVLGPPWDATRTALAERIADSAALAP